MLAVDDSLFDCDWTTEVLAVDDWRGAAGDGGGDGEDDSEELRK